MHPYSAVLRQPGLRRLLPALALSALGDGMSEVSVAWLALQLAPDGTGAVWVAVCGAAMVLPGTLVALLRRRSFAPASAARVGTADAALHAIGLGAVPVAAAAGVLDVRLLPVLLGLSSLLAVYGTAARYTVVAAVLSEQDRLAGNAALSTLAQTGVLAGPAVAALVLATAGPVAAVAVDAATFALLAVAYRLAAPYLQADAGRPALVPSPTGEAPAADVRVPGTVTGVLVLTAVFYGLYGPVGVGLPVHVAEDLQAPASLFAAFVTVFGVGALLGGLAAGFLGRVPERVLVPLIPVGWGACLLPLGLGAPTAVSLVAFGAGAFVLGPYFAVTTTLVQRLTPPALLPHVLSRRGVLIDLASLAGVLVAGPLVQVAGAAGAVLASALATIALGVVTVLVTARRGPTIRVDGPAGGNRRTMPG